MNNFGIESIRHFILDARTEPERRNDKKVKLKHAFAYQLNEQVKNLIKNEFEGITVVD